MNRLDPEIATRFRSGDREAFRLIVEQYQNQLFRLGLKLLGQPAEASDFIQDSFLRAFERRAQFDPGRPFDPWLYKVALNVGRERLRRRRELPLGERMPEGSQAAEAEENLQQQDQQKIVREALARIKPIYRESLALRFESELSLKEMARALGLSLGTIKSRLSRGINAFQKAYHALGGEAA